MRSIISAICEHGKRFVSPIMTLELRRTASLAWDALSNLLMVLGFCAAMCGISGQMTSITA